MVAPSGEQAVANARAVDTYPAGMCLKYQREAWRIGSLYGSAIDAWHGAVHRHPGDRNPPLGAVMFYDGGQYGHIVMCTKANTETMRSTDMPSSGRVTEGDLDWPVVHWGQKYLGWSSDLNGVDLPLQEEDEMTPDDWDKLRNIVRDEVAKAQPAGVDKTWDEVFTVTKPNGQEEKKSARQVLRETWQRVAKQ